jgi:YegS/Rv2252/BmrU family lipid kinase
MMRTCAIVNPAAGRGRTAHLWPQLEPAIRATTHDLTVRTTTAPGEATTLTRSALRDAYDRIVAVGGDGTLHEVVNGYFEPDGTALSPAPPLVVLPCGTGMDFNRMLGAKTGLDAVSYLRSGRTRPIDLLRLAYTDRDGTRAHRYAANIASVGLSGDVVRAMDRGGRFLPTPRLRYLAAIVRALLSHTPIRVDLTLDGVDLGEWRVRVVAAANGHTFGAGIQIAPNAAIDDGQLDVTILGDVPASRLFRNVTRFYDGRHLSLDGVTTHRGRRLTIRPLDDVPVWLEADGELLGRLPATVEVVPDAIQIQY